MNLYILIWPKVWMSNAFICFPLPSGILVPMCFCGDPCRIAKSEEEETYNQRYWMCENYTLDPVPRQIRIGLMVRIEFIFFVQYF